MIRVELPYHLRLLAGVDREVSVEVAGGASVSSVLDAVEARYPMLRGTIRDQITHQRRSLLRFCACGKDISNEPADAPLPDAVLTGEQPLLTIAAIAGG